MRRIRILPHRLVVFVLEPVHCGQTYEDNNDGRFDRNREPEPIVVSCHLAGDGVAYSGKLFVGGQ